MPNVKVILNEKVDKLGEVGEIVAVRPGYARNFLLPKRLASLLTQGEVKRVLKKKEILEKQYQDEKIQAEGTVEKLNKLGQIVISAKAGEAGKLFGRITIKDIAEKISAEAGVDINRKQVLLKRSISEIGEYEVKLKLHNDVETKINVLIKNEE